MEWQAANQGNGNGRMRKWQAENFGNGKRRLEEWQTENVSMEDGEGKKGMAIGKGPSLKGESGIGNGKGQTANRKW